MMAKLSSEGKRFSLITIIRGDKVEKAIVVDGKSVLGFLTKDLIDLGQRAMDKGSKIIVEKEGVRIIAEPIEPRIPLIIVGSGVIAKAIGKLANVVGFIVMSVGNGDLTPDFESFSSFTSNSIDILDQIVNEYSYVIVANEGGKPYDVDAVQIAIKHKAKYVGLLASQKRGAVIIYELIKRGLSIEDIKERLYSPMGLDIGSKTAEEIALSILAEVVKVARGGTGRHLKEIKDPYLLLKDAEEGKITDKCTFIPRTASDLS